LDERVTHVTAGHMPSPKTKMHPYASFWTVQLHALQSEELSPNKKQVGKDLMSKWLHWLLFGWQTRKTGTK